MPQQTLRPIGTMVDLADPTNPTVILHYQVIGHVQSFDGVTVTEILQLRGKETRPGSGKREPKVKK